MIHLTRSELFHWTVFHVFLGWTCARALTFIAPNHVSGIGIVLSVFVGLVLLHTIYQRRQAARNLGT